MYSKYKYEYTQGLNFIAGFFTILCKNNDKFNKELAYKLLCLFCIKEFYYPCKTEKYSYTQICNDIDKKTKNKELFSTFSEIKYVEKYVNDNFKDSINNINKDILFFRLETIKQAITISLLLDNNTIIKENNDFCNKKTYQNLIYFSLLFDNLKIFYDFIIMNILKLIELDDENLYTQCIKKMFQDQKNL